MVEKIRVKDVILHIGFLSMRIGIVPTMANGQRNANKDNLMKYALIARKARCDTPENHLYRCAKAPVIAPYN